MPSFFQIRVLLLIVAIALVGIGTWGTLTSIPVFLFLLFIVITYGTSFLGSQWLPLDPDRIKAVIRESHLTSDKRFYDLGSGDGRVVRAVARDTHAIATGFEIEPIKFSYSILRNWLSGLSNAHTRRESFFTGHFFDADVVFMWLPQKTVDRLQPRLKKLRKGTLVISCQMKCRDLKLIKTCVKEKLFIYRV